LLFVAPFWRAGVTVCECVVRADEARIHAYTHTHTRAQTGSNGMGVKHKV
jgi:hypothetical protein